jgi:hypothetical protein
MDQCYACTMRRFSAPVLLILLSVLFCGVFLVSPLQVTWVLPSLGAERWMVTVAGPLPDLRIGVTHVAATGIITPWLVLPIPFLGLVFLIGLALGATLFLHLRR